MNDSKLKIFDPIRYKNLHVTPEECVRQGLLTFLTDELGYPKNLIIVEKGLRTLLPLLNCKDTYLPKRRPDVLVITPTTYIDDMNKQHDFGHPKPLWLIECKAEVINQKTINQVLSYNYVIGAPCLSVVSYNKQKTGFINPETQTLDFYPGLPSYSQLISYYLKIKRLNT
ncbi:type I restriction enzyme R domain family protein [Chlamydia ibidis]|uniref:Type I restriction enzyme R domain family protein n=2 Tax=Chlamydia ibidis TaxID=1405396 RepID=S7J5F6_9CHLA|nr:type I restriction enzyme HsdR N-terminal domain-containing protein [Chlamydia ibidis]EPP35463.1 type I restriction enzyme R domain family protein [Chlamydia ibidis]EQM63174.1 hypothetical protein H359_0231 [Chlamydia ibidis 10-1398/6]